MRHISRTLIRLSCVVTLTCFGLSCDVTLSCFGLSCDVTLSCFGLSCDVYVSSASKTVSMLQTEQCVVKVQQRPLLLYFPTQNWENEPSVHFSLCYLFNFVDVVFVFVVVLEVICSFCLFFKWYYDMLASRTNSSTWHCPDLIIIYIGWLGVKHQLTYLPKLGYFQCWMRLANLYLACWRATSTCRGGISSASKCMPILQSPPIPISLASTALQWRH